MTWDEKEKIAYLREEGYGYKSIATKLSLPLDTVKAIVKGMVWLALRKRKGQVKFAGVAAGRSLNLVPDGNGNSAPINAGTTGGKNIRSL